MGVRIGIDVGERSLGIAAVDYDDDGWPIEILAAVSHLHDGGMDPGTAKSPESRLATAGVARRTRRLYRNRRRRLKLLDEVLIKHGIPVPGEELIQTHDAWYARSLLSQKRVEDEQIRFQLLSLALRHMARHRGWRNPWWTYDRLCQAPSPSPALLATVDAARTRFGPEVVGSPVTVGQLVASVVTSGAAIRPIKGALSGEVGPVLSEQVKQEDTLAEARLILTTQGIDQQVSDEICRALMHAAKPTIPRERIGRCTLMPDLARASSATLEFQEYRVRAAVANLRIKPENRRLSDDEYDRVCDALMSWYEPEWPRWRDVADLLGIPVRYLAQPSIDQEGGGAVPVDRTSLTIRSKFGKSSALGKWWREVEWEDKAELVEFISDLSGSQDEPASDAVADLLVDDTGKVAEALESLELETGRSSYSRAALQRMLAIMRTTRCDAHTARKEAFDLPDDWAPPAPTFDDNVEHPTVARINALVRRFLITATDKWGVPESVAVEHVRGGFMGPTGLAELKKEINSNTSRREKAKAELIQQGIERPSSTDVQRHECLQRQNSQCLYCGTAIGMSTSELDHIVPRIGGGSNRRDNLVAVCRPCNADKGRTPFAVWADAHPRPGVSVEETSERVRAWQASPGMTQRQLARLKRDVTYRLSLQEDDEGFGEQSLESTAYAARQMRARIQSFLVSQAGEGASVHAYAGIVTSEARKAAGIDDMIRLRDFTRKSRLDRRHHAVDAAVLTSLRPTVAQTLKQRTNLQAEHRATGKYPEWKNYKGAQPGDVANFDAWAARALALAQLIKDRIDSDRVPVVRPLRLTPRTGALHADTVEPLDHVDIQAPMDQSTILRIVNPRLHRALIKEADGGNLDADAGRATRLSWDSDLPVDLYPSTAAHLLVRGGAAAIGGTARFARIYAWPTKDGFGYGMIRLFAGEFARLGFLRSGVDLFTAPLPEDSQAIRTAHPGILDRIRTGTARQIGWITLNDEIEIDPAEWAAKGGKIGDFTTELPERHWYVSGFFSATRISIAPALLAHEGVDDSTPEVVRTILAANRIPLAVNGLFSSNCAVIRRTVTGSVRWQGQGLPTSWRPREAAERAFKS